MKYFLCLILSIFVYHPNKAMETSSHKTNHAQVEYQNIRTEAQRSYSNGEWSILIKRYLSDDSLDNSFCFTGKIVITKPQEEGIPVLVTIEKEELRITNAKIEKPLILNVKTKGQILYWQYFPYNNFEIK